MSSIARRAAAALGVALLSMPASAHGGTAAATGLSVPRVVAGIVLVSLLGGGFVLVAYGRLPWSTGRAALPVLAVQTGFVVGVAVGLGVVVGMSPTAEAGLLALVGGVLLTVGTREGRRLHVAGVVPA